MISSEMEETIAELDDFLTGKQTFWNKCHGSVTGDCENQMRLTFETDNAHIIGLAAKLNALVFLEGK